MYSEVVPHSKRDIKAGETVGSIGSADFYNKIYTYKEAREKKAVPMGLTAGGKAIKDIRKGEMFTEDNFAPDASTFVYKLRMMQDAMYENQR